MAPDFTCIPLADVLLCHLAAEMFGFERKGNQVKKAIVIAAVVFSLGASACSGEFTDTANEEFNDVRVSDRNDEPALIINMPNRFSNVAFKCNGSTGVYVTMHDTGRSVAVAPNDPECPSSEVGG